VLLINRYDCLASSTRTESGGNVLAHPPAPVSMPGPIPADSDGDGVPDHHDFCPSLNCSPGDKLCAPHGWVSGRATDFDADGCADGTEDVDKDNDGIIDSRDKCPFTPQKYVFVSNADSDFDGDGCADGLEDSDDDGDAVPNILDSCPRTAPWDVSDNDGCSNFQHQRPETLELHRLAAAQTTLVGIGRPAEGPSKGAKAEQEEKEPTRWEAWLETLQGAGIEVIVGGILTAILGSAYSIYEKLHDKLPSDPKDSVRRLSSGVADGLRTVRSKSSSSLKQGLSLWKPSMASLRSHRYRIVGYLLVVYISRYHRELLSLAGWRAGLSSGALWLSSSLESLSTSLSAE